MANYTLIDIAKAIFAKTGTSVAPARVTKVPTYSVEKIFISHQQAEGKTILCREREDGSLDIREVDWKE